MKRSAFTMIELIFVIVILGILAAVAIPKLAGVQDDAMVSSENTGIASIRAGTTAIRGRALTRRADFNVTVTGPAAGGGVDDSYVTYDIKTTPNTTASAQLWPMLLSSSDTTVASGTEVTLADEAGALSTATTAMPLISVLEPEGRDAWSTVALTDGNVSISGPASGTIDGSANAQLDLRGSWLYNVVNGSVVYRPTKTFGTD